VLIESLGLENFRVFKKSKFNFNSETTLITGANGSGKTSLLESVNILLTGKSFRTKSVAECLAESQEYFTVKSTGSVKGMPANFGTAKQMHSKLVHNRTIGGIKIKKLQLPFVQLFLGKRLFSLEGEPELRRHHFYNLMFHVKPDLETLYKEYSHAIKQRNKGLKKKLPKGDLYVWTKRVAELGESITGGSRKFFTRYRSDVLEFISSLNKKDFKFLNNLDLKYKSGWDLSGSFLEGLEESLDKDYALGYTSLGPHRQDYIFTSSKKRSSSVLSRGQSKILILLEILSSSKISEESILFLIDDLSSELDKVNFNLALEQIVLQNNQAIVTSITDDSSADYLTNFSDLTRINL
tara:strand:+ start:15261 stop:16316 length:1056 start_codon:yes stop_codon:yes gene_type:complete